ncbi:hypothetical protein T06_9089 [Trichinella sp. T6]|nr:hypothetical protein T06_9089 [Trichinella sp. T6]
MANLALRLEVSLESSAKSSNALKTGCLIISKGAFVCLIYVAISSIVERSLRSLRAFKEWSKENVKTRTARSRTREGKRVLVCCFAFRRKFTRVVSFRSRQM